MSDTSTTSTRAPHSWDQYTTVAVTPLPTGWHNVYRDNDGKILSEPCPILLQELRATNHYSEPPHRDGSVTEHRPPFDTRTALPTATLTRCTT